MVNIKGNFLYRVKSYFIDKIGRSDFDELLEKCEPATKDIFNKIITSGDWYDLHAFENVITVIDKDMGRAELQDLAYYMAEKMIHGFFGLNIQFTSTQALLGQMQEIWNKSFSEGKYELFEHTDKNIKIKFSNIKITGSLLFWLEKYLQKWFEITSKKHYYSTNEKLGETITVINYEYVT